MFNLFTVKEHLRITHNLEDDLLMAYMAAAQDWANRSWANHWTTLKLCPAPSWPVCCSIPLCCMNPGKVSL